MNDQDQQNMHQDSADQNIPLGAGVDISQSKKVDIDDVEYELYNDDVGIRVADAKQKILTLKEKLRLASKEKQEYLDGWQRLKADFANYKKREEDSKEEFIKFARENFILDIIPVLESFQMAFANKDAWEKIDSSWRKGVEYIHTQLLNVLGDNGLTIENPTGKVFDPTEHTAIERIQTQEQEMDHHIAEVVQPGYRLNGKLIRSAKVKVFGKDEIDATSRKEGE